MSLLDIDTSLNISVILTITAALFCIITGLWMRASHADHYEFTGRRLGVKLMITMIAGTIASACALIAPVIITALPLWVEACTLTPLWVPIIMAIIKITDLIRPMESATIAVYAAFAFGVSITLLISVIATTIAFTTIPV